MLALLRQEFVQRGEAEILLLAVVAGLLGTWIVVRGLAFWTHAVGTAAFPGLVLADGIGIPAALGGVAAAIVLAVILSDLRRRRPEVSDAATALALVGALATGVILASNVFGSQARVDGLLFGSLLAIRSSDLALAAAVVLVAALAGYLLGPRWLAIGLEPRTARATGIAARVPDAVLAALVGAAVVASLAAAGALMAPALLVVPAATTRLFTDRPGRWRALTALLAAIDGLVGIALAAAADLPPGAVVAALAGGLFALAVVARRAGASARVAGLATIACALAAGAGALAFGQPAYARGQGIAIVATTTQLADITRAVGAGAIDVHGILQPSSDPHGFEPRPSDAEAIADARLVVESGLGLDPWVGRLAPGGSRVLDVSRTIPIVRPGDPHWWHDPRNVEAAATAIGKALARIDPAHAATYRTSARAYVARVSRLDAAIATCFGTVPARDRLLVTDHDALGYAAARYGIRVVGAIFPSQSVEGATSVESLGSLIDAVRRLHVRAVFPEVALNGGLARQIAQATGARSDLALYGDSLGPAGSGAATYLAMAWTNATRMVVGMGGTPGRCAP
jgi:ABC-type Zn uptake system ZnuABC Zn-binding protein ZnuA/ABC-type Mn2+/Zn2+ transport system permease subunit